MGGKIFLGQEVELVVCFSQKEKQRNRLAMALITV